jgi:hypothetical protein
MLYRCEFGATRAIPADMNHPRTVYVAEASIVDPLDRWLAQIVSPEAIAAAQKRQTDVTARDAAARAKMADYDRRSQRLVASVEEGMPAESNRSPSGSAPLRPRAGRALTAGQGWLPPAVAR